MIDGLDSDSESSLRKYCLDDVTSTAYISMFQ